MPDANEWLSDFAAELGVALPDPEALEAILELAAVAAHASERWTAPVSCWLAAAAGTSLEDAIAVARRLAHEPRD